MSTINNQSPVDLRMTGSAQHPFIYRTLTLIIIIIECLTLPALPQCSCGSQLIPRKGGDVNAHKTVTRPESRGTRQEKGSRNTADGRREVRGRAQGGASYAL